MKKTKIQTKAEIRDRKKRQRMAVSGKSVLKIRKIITQKNSLDCDERLLTKEV